MVTTVVGNFSPYSRTKRIPRASSPDPQCERPWLLRGHQLSRSLAIATGRRSQKENFHLPPTPQGSQTLLSFAHTLNTGIVAFGAGLSQGLEKSSSPYICLESQSLCPGRSQSVVSATCWSIEGQSCYPAVSSTRSDERVVITTPGLGS